MADSDNIGSLSVDVTADTTPVLDSLTVVEEKLTALAESQTAIKINAGELDTIVKLITEAKGQLDSFKGERPVVNIDAKVTFTNSSADVRKAIQESLEAEPFKINVEIGNLEALKNQLSGLQVPINAVFQGVNFNDAGGGTGTGGGNAARSSIANILNHETTNAVDDIGELFKKLSKALSGTDKPLRAATDSVDQFLAIVDRFGTDLVDPKLFTAKTPAESRSLRASGSLGREALKELGIEGDLSQSISRHAASVQARIISRPSGQGEAPFKELVAQALSGGGGGGGGSAPIIINLSGGQAPIINNAGGQASQSAQEPPVIERPGKDPLEVLRAVRAESDKRAAEQRASYQEPVRVIPADFSGNIKKLREDQKTSKEQAEARANGLVWSAELGRFAPIEPTGQQVSVVGKGATLLSTGGRRGPNKTPIAEAESKIADVEKKIVSYREQADAIEGTIEEMKSAPDREVDLGAVSDLRKQQAELRASAEAMETGRRSVPETKKNPKTGELEPTGRMVNSQVPGSLPGLRARLARLQKEEQERQGPKPEDVEAERRSGLVQSLAYGPLRGNGIDLTDFLELANRGAFMHYGEEEVRPPVPKMRTDRKTGQKRAVLDDEGKPVMARGEPEIRLIEFDPTIDNDLEEKLPASRSWATRGKRKLRRADSLELFKKAVGEEHGPEGVALVDKSIEEEGRNSPVIRALRGVLSFPGSSTVSERGSGKMETTRGPARQVPVVVGGEIVGYRDAIGHRYLDETSSPSQGRSGSGRGRDARPTGSKPTAQTEREDNEWRQALQEIRQRDPAMGHAITEALRADAAAGNKASRERIASEVSDTELNRMYRSQGRSPLEALERVLTQRVGIEQGQLIDPNVFVQAFDRMADNTDAPRGTWAGQLTRRQVRGEPTPDNPRGPLLKTSEWEPTGFKPGSLVQEVGRVVQAIISQPNMLEMNPQNARYAEGDVSELGMKGMAKLLRGTKAVVQVDDQMVPTDLGYLADQLQDLPQIVYERDRDATETARNSDNARGRGTVTKATAAERRINTPAQSQYRERRKALAALEAERTKMLQEAESGADIEALLAVTGEGPGSRDAEGGINFKGISAHLKKIKGLAESEKPILGPEDAAARDAASKEYSRIERARRSPKYKATKGAALERDTKLVDAEIGRKRLALEAELETERGPIPAGLTYVQNDYGQDEDAPDPRGLVAPDTEAALGYVVGRLRSAAPPELRPSIGMTIQSATKQPKATGRKAEVGAARAAARHFIDPNLEKPVIPEGVTPPSGKELLEGPEFEALADSVKAEVRALIEKRDDKGAVTGYRGIENIGMPAETRDTPDPRSAREDRKRTERAYAGVLPGSNVVDLTADPKDIVAQILDQIKGVPKATAESTPAYEEAPGHTLIGGDTPLRREASEAGGGGGRFGGETLNVKVLNWPEALLTGAAIGAAAGGGGGRGEPPAPPSGEPEGEPEGEPSAGKPRKKIRTKRTRAGVLPVIDFINDDPENYEPLPVSMSSAGDRKLKTTRPISTAHSGPELAITAAQRERAAKEQMYSRMLLQVEDRDAKIESRAQAVAENNRQRAMGNLRNNIITPETQRRQVSYRSEDFYSRMFDQVDRRDDYVRQRDPSSGRMYYGPYATSPAATKPTKYGRAADRDADLRATYMDEADTELEAIRGQLRSANRAVPKRGFGASITDLVTSMAGGDYFEKSLGRLGRAERESSEITTLRTRQADLRTRRDVLIEAVKNAPTPEAKKAIGVGQLAPIMKELRQLEPAIKRSTDVFNENVKAVTSTSAVMKNFGAAAAGSVVSTMMGSVTMGLGMAVTGPLIAAVSEGLTAAIGPAFERASGFGMTATRVNAGIADRSRQLAGRTDIAYAETTAAAGLAYPTAQKMAPIITDAADIQAGNKALQEQIDLLHTFEKTLSEGQKKNLTQTQGGILGWIGGTGSTAELIFNELNGPDSGLVSKSEWATKQKAYPERIRIGRQQEQQLTTAIASMESQNLAPGSDEAKMLQSYKAQLSQLQANLKIAEEEGGPSLDTHRLQFFNEALDKTGKSLFKFASGVEEDQPLLDKQAEAWNKIYAPGMASLAASGKAVVKQGDQVVTDPKLLQEALDTLNRGAPKPDLRSLMDINKQDIRNQFQLEDIAGQMALGTGQFKGQGILAAEEGIALAQSPIGSATSGIAKQDQKGNAAAIRDIKADYKSINTLQDEGIAAAKSYVAEWLKGTEFVAQFESSLTNVVDLGKQISDIQIGRETAHAEYAAKQYNFQIYQVSRSLKDARNLQKALNGEAANGLGAIQGQQFLLQRELTALGFELTQKQINFNTAIAGITSVGLTGQERAARIEQAKIEAAYAQKQLDIQKKLFGLEGKGFRITVDRSVFDLTRQLGLLQEGRQITIDDALAQKKIKGLTVALNKELKIVNKIFDQAQTRAGDMISLSGQFAKALSEDAAKVFRQLINYYWDYYDGLMNRSGGQGGTAPRSGDRYNAAGFLGTVSGATNMIMGEAGDETVAILRNPRNVDGASMGGGGPVFNIVISGNKFSTEEEEKAMIMRLQAAIERSMGFKGTMYGLRRH